MDEDTDLKSAGRKAQGFDSLAFLQRSSMSRALESESQLAKGVRFQIVSLRVQILPGSPLSGMVVQKLIACNPSGSRLNLSQQG
jgi:hypothetical protein